MDQNCHGIDSLLYFYLSETFQFSDINVVINCYVLISAHSPEKLPASKVADVAEAKVGVATCIPKTEVANSADSDTYLKQPASSTSGRNVDVHQLPFLQDTEPKQIESLSSFLASTISLHEDDPSLALGTGAAQQQVHQSDDINMIHCLNLTSDVATRSDNYSNFRSHIFPVRWNILKFVMFFTTTAE